MKKAISTALLFLLFLSACTLLSGCELNIPGQAVYTDAKVIKLNGTSAELDGTPIEEFDYTWHCDPSITHDDVKSAPAEYYTGTKPETDAAAYIDHELYYFPKLPESGFTLVNYDGEQEWAYYYTDGENDKYIFATLPNLGRTLPSDMMHSEDEAAENKVLHIASPGTYILSGEWDGQILIDLNGEDEAFTDESAKVTLVLDGVTINCTAAPGLIAADAYECDNGWEDREEHSADISTENAGVNIIIADGSENSVTGTNVFRMLKTKYKDEDSTDAVKVQKKMRKTDAAFYSYVSMNISGEKNGTGKLTVNSGFEGLDSELHLTILGGNITVNSQDDGINVNEDNVSVANFKGGSVTLNAALGAEGDGVDSNGFIVIDGGNLIIDGITAPDNALDSEDGVYYYSGTVTIDGEKQDYKQGDVFRASGSKGRPGGFGPGNWDPGNFVPGDNDFKPGDNGGFGPGGPEKPDDDLADLQRPPEIPDGGVPGRQAPPDVTQDPDDRPEPPAQK